MRGYVTRRVIQARRGERNWHERTRPPRGEKREKGLAYAAKAAVGGRGKSP